MWSCEEISKLVTELEVPDHWTPDESELSYRILSKIILAIENHGLVLKGTVLQILKVLAPSYSLTNVSNFICKVRRQTGKRLDDIFPLVSSSSFIGPYCKAAGISEQWLRNDDSDVVNCNVHATNGIVCELNEYRARNGKPWKVAQSWISKLFSITDSDKPAIGTVQTQFSLLVKRKAKIQGGKDKQKLIQFLEAEYKIPQKLKDVRDQASVKSVMSFMLDEVQKIVKVDEHVAGEPDSTADIDLTAVTEAYIQALEELEELRAFTEVTKLKWEKEKNTRRAMAKELAEITERYKQTVKTVDSLREKVSKYTPRNVNKRERRWATSKLNLSTTVKELKTENEKLSSELEKMVHQKWNKSKLVRYYKEERDKKTEEKGCTKCTNLKHKYEEILSGLEEKVEELTCEASGSKVVQTYEMGHYNDKVVKLYINLLIKYNVGARHASGIVKEVLSELGGLEAERLPKYTWVTQVLIRARTLSQIQVLEELLKGDNNTLHLDGTSKRGEHYGTFDVSTESGTYVIGLQDMSGGTAYQYYETFDSIISEVSKVLDHDDKDINKSKIIASLKNMMTDRCIVNSKFTELLESARRKHLPNSMDNWSSLSTEQQEKILQVNDFYCGLHYIVGLADHAENALKIWEGIIATQPLGAMAKGFRSSKGESGIQRLVRTSVKAFEEHGCEASGVMGPFENFLAGKGLACHLKPFRGNRFNILFEDGGAVFYHHDHMTEFILKNCPTPNHLIKAVMADLAEDVYLAGARALGIIGQRLTTPLWSVLESDIHIFEMNSKYQHIVRKLNSWAADPSELLEEPTDDDDLGKSLVPSVHNEVSRALYLEDISEQVKLMTVEALRLMCAAMVRVSERMLTDHLTGGKWVSTSPELIHETKSVPMTNIASEHDFGQLDRLKREKPNANTIAFEALIMYVTNHTSSWFEKLSSEKQHKFLTQAREQAPSVRTAFYKQRQLIKDQLTTQRLEKERLKQEKDVKRQKEKEELTRQLSDCGGLWAEDEVEEKVDGLSSEKQRQTLAAQLKFRHRVMLQRAPETSMWYLSKGGKLKTIAELISNLQTIIQHNHAVVPSEASTTEGSSCYRQEDERRKLLAESVLKIQKQMKDDKLKLMSKKRHRESQKRLASPSKRSHVSIPNIPDFSGKRVEHLYEDEATGAEDWYVGTVLRRVSDGRTKDPLKVLYEIHYDDGDKAEINLAEDFLNGELRILEEP